VISGCRCWAHPFRTSRFAGIGRVCARSYKTTHRIVGVGPETGRARGWIGRLSSRTPMEWTPRRLGIQLEVQAPPPLLFLLPSLPLPLLFLLSPSPLLPPAALSAFSAWSPRPPCPSRPPGCPAALRVQPGTRARERSLCRGRRGWRPHSSSASAVLFPRGYNVARS